MMHHQANSFSMLFKPSYDENEQYHQMLYPFASPPSSSSVDCTLSLGTPSTRSSGGGGDRYDERRPTTNAARGRSRSKFGCWDFLQGKSSSSSGSSSNGGDGSSNGMINSDPLLARRCANCDTTSTPLWRNGPRGPKSLCNACGIRFKKEERRATAATASSGGMDGVHYTYQNNNTWGNNNAGQRMPCFSPANEFRFIDDSDTTHHDTAGGGGGIPFLPWMLNVADRPTGLVHDFTR